MTGIQTQYYEYTFWINNIKDRSVGPTDILKSREKTSDIRDLRLGLGLGLDSLLCLDTALPKLFCFII